MATRIQEKNRARQHIGYIVIQKNAEKGNQSLLVCQGKNNVGKEAKVKTAARLPENSRNSFVDLQPQKDSKTNRPKLLNFLN